MELDSAVRGPKLPGQMQIAVYDEDNEPKGVVLDALPYIDPKRSANLKSQVKFMVEEEMKSFEPVDYLAHLPLPETKLLVTKPFFSAKSSV